MDGIDSLAYHNGQVVSWKLRQAWGIVKRWCDGQEVRRGIVFLATWGINLLYQKTDSMDILSELVV